jgi:hypothetical protein
MLGASLVLCVSLGQAPAGDPFVLVARLGDRRFAEREAAAAALEQLGRAALPALRSVRDAKDPEVRARAAGLLTRIEGALLTKPSMVSLNFENATLPDVVKAISEQTGIKVVLLPETSPAWRDRRLTLREASPLPFWRAIDRLCEQARLQYNYGLTFPASGREPAFPLFEGGGRPPLPVSDSGPFRVTVVSIHYQKDFNFLGGMTPGRVLTRARPAVTPHEQFYAQLQVTGEPRLAVSLGGQLRVTEAVDDKGQVLVIPPPNGPMSQRMSGYYGLATGPVVQVQAVMNRPSQAGALIKTLKGVVPVSVSTRKPNPLTVSLASAKGRTFQNEDVALTVHEVRDPANNRPGSLEVTIRPVPGSPSSGSFGVNEMPVRPDAHQQQVDVVDAQGRPMPWYQTGFDAENGRLTMTFPVQDPGMKPAELRYYGLVRAETEVPFQFNDLPLP